MGGDSSTRPGTRSWSSHDALKPGKRFCDRLDGRRLREYRALDHDHGQRQRTGSFELGGGAGASRVFGDDQFDSMSLEQCALVGDVKRPARGDQLNTRRQLLRRGRLDAAHNIEVLWRCSGRARAPCARWWKTRRGSCPIAAAAASRLSTMIQRSPSRWAQGGRRMARNSTRFFRPPPHSPSSAQRRDGLRQRGDRSAPRR